MNIDYKKFLPHVLVILAFVLAAIAYFNPVLQGKVIYQNDIALYKGMAKERDDFREKQQEESYWTDAAFGGMPTYQLGAQYPYNFIKKIDRSLRFLPRPADYLFLYFIGLYILLLALKRNYKTAFLGALAFGFSTYLIIILGVGHNAKAHAIAYIPVVLAGIVLIFRQKHIGGGLLLALGMALEICANHFQMTYYLLLLVIVLGIAYLIDFYKKKKLPQYFKALGIMIIAVLIAVGTNATNLLATQEYTQFSTRGDTGLNIDKSGNSAEKTSGLTYDYITEYSYGIIETFNLFIPRFMGGGNTEKLDEDSNVYQAIIKMGASPQQAKNFAENAPTYWGNQPIVAAPAYIGATVIFLSIFALYLIRGRLKWWLIGGSILALLLSWGDNFASLTKFFIEYVPLYDKFRAVTSIQVLIELCLPILAVFGLSKLLSATENLQQKKHALKWASIIAGGTALLFLLLKNVFFDFSGTNDRMLMEQAGPEFMRALKEDRKTMFTTDTIRSLVFVLLSAGVIWFYLKEKLAKKWIVPLLAILIVADLVAVDRRYVNNDDFVNAREMDEPFQPTTADQQIMKDDGHFRVLDLSSNPLNSSRASYFHHSLGGYHAAKLGKMQELFDFHINKRNEEALNMLNTKYTIIANQGKMIAQPNANANGNAWFVQNVVITENPDEELLALDSLNTKQTAVVNQTFSDLLPTKKFTAEDSDTIELTVYTPNRLTYSYTTSEEQIAVFSEVYYPHGWKAYVDGEEIPHFQANYVLRAAVLPAGKHELVFKFDPEVVKTGSNISLASNILLGILLLGGIVYAFKKKKSN